MKIAKTGRARRYGLILAAALSGGTTITSCDTRVRRDLVDGTKAWIFSLFDPNLILDSLIPDTLPDEATE